MRMSGLDAIPGEGRNVSTVRRYLSDFVTVLIRGFDCAGNLVNDRGSGPAEFAFSPSLQTASVAGTITTREGRSVDVDVSWEGTGPLESTSPRTTGRRRTASCASRRACGRTSSASTG